MTRLAPAENWVLKPLNEMELAELIERHIDFYTEGEDGNRRSVHLPMKFVRHYMQRNDGALPTATALATAPLVLADGSLLAPESLDRDRGIIFKIPEDLRAILPRPEDCTKERINKAMEFLRDQWLVDVATDGTGKAILVAAALTLIERSLLPERPVFLVTAGRRGCGKTTTAYMLIRGALGPNPIVTAWAANEEERRKALLAEFVLCKPYILWDNIPRGMQIACPHIERSCTTKLYADRKLGVTEMVLTSASTIHILTGNNIGARGDLASRALHIRLGTDSADPENREFEHPDPIGWTRNNRAEIMTALYTILLGNPQLKTPSDSTGKTRFKVWWRLVGSAVEHAARLVGQELDFQTIFLDQEKENDDESASLADALEILVKRWPEQFSASDLDGMVNTPSPNDEEQTLRDFLMPGALPSHRFSTKSIGRLLKKHLDEPVKSGERTLVLRSIRDARTKVLNYQVVIL